MNKYIQQYWTIDYEDPDPYRILKCPNPKCGHEQAETKWVGWHSMEIEAKCPKCKCVYLHDCETGASDLIFVKNIMTLKQKLNAIKFKYQLEKGD